MLSDRRLNPQNETTQLPTTWKEEMVFVQWITLSDHKWFLLGERHSQTGTSWSGGDFTGDGVVNSADLNSLALNWLQSIPVAASDVAVPEPFAVTLALLAVAMFGGWHRRKS